MILFLKKYWAWILLSIVVIGTVWYIISLKNEIAEKNGKIYYTDSLMKVKETVYKKVATEFISLTQAMNYLKSRNDSLYEQLKKDDQEIRAYSQIVLQLKAKTYTRIDTIYKFVVKDSIIQVPIGYDKVTISEENSLFKIDGETYLYPHKGYTLTFTGKPFQIDVVVSENSAGVFTAYLDSKSKDLELITFDTKVLRTVETCWWKKFSLIGGIGLTTRNTSLDLNLIYGKWGVKGIVGFDYNNYLIDKSNVFWGAGITFKIF